MKRTLFLIASIALVFAADAVNADSFSGTLNTGILQTGLTGIVIGPPTASPVSGTYNSTQTITITVPTGAQNVYYTTNSSTPSCGSSSLYSSTIAVANSETIKAVSCYTDGGSSSVASFAYVIPLQVAPADLPTLLTNGAFVLPNGGTSTSTPSIQVAQAVAVTVTTNGNASTVSIPQNTTITAVSGQNFSPSALTATSLTTTSLSGLGTGAVVEGALHWGIDNLGLQFSAPITLSIYVGTSLNGQTLNVQRSADQGQTWTTDGLVNTTCVVTNGYCNFQSSKASYYATYQIQTAVSSSGGGGGGGGGYVSTASTTTTVTAVAGDLNADGKIDEYDLAIMMADWGTVTGTVAADLNHDGTVDEYDLALLMANWS